MMNVRLQAKLHTKLNARKILIFGLTPKEFEDKKIDDAQRMVLNYDNIDNISYGTEEDKNGPKDNNDDFDLSNQD